MNAVQTARFVHTSHLEGIGWSSAKWHRSALMDQVRALPDDTVVYSNAPDGVYLHTARPVIGLPRRIGADFEGGTDGYAAELAQIADRMRGGAAIVQIGGLGVRSSSSVVVDLERLMPLRVVAESADGQILVADSR